MLDLYQEIDWSDVLKTQPEMEIYIKRAAEEQSKNLKSQEYERPVHNFQKNEHIILVGLPQVPNEKLQVFNKILNSKVFVKLQIDQSITNCSYGYQDESQKMGNGSAILSFKSVDAARFAADQLNNFILDKNHTFKAFTVSDYENIVNMSETFTAPKSLNKKELQNWMTLSELKEQITYQVDDQFYNKWFDHIEMTCQSENQITLNGDYKSTFWTQSGSYLVQIGKDEFQLYGGNALEKLNIYQHHEVSQVQLSNDDKYIISFSQNIQYTKSSENFVIWSVESGQKLRSFRGSKYENWGSFQFSPCSKYVARGSQNNLKVYQLPDMTLLQDSAGNKINIETHEIMNFKWLLNSKQICVVCTKIENGKQTQAFVKLIDIQTKQDYKKWKTLTFQISKSDIYCQQNKEWCCVIFTKRYKKHLQTSVQIANLQSKNLEIADIDLQFKQSSYAIEQNTGKFCFINEEIDQASQIKKFDFHFYYIDKEKFQLKEINKILKKVATECLFSSNGQFFVLVNKEDGNPYRGILEFYSIKQQEKNIKIKMLKEEKMIYMSHAEWDPSGKLLMTASQNTRTYIIWNCYGKMLYKDIITKEITNIQWRIRPHISISDKREKEIIANLPQICKKYELDDDKVINKAKHEKELQSINMKNEFLQYIQNKRKLFQDSKAQRVQLLGFDEDRAADKEDVFELERILSQKEI